MNAANVQVIAQLSIQPAAVDRALAALQRLAEVARAADGNLRFEVMQHAAEPARLVTVETWRDAGAADAHMGSAAVGEVLGALGPMLAAPPAIERYAQRA